ncbi:MAG: hypothetical protein JNK48_01885 [Bryobacterales bacterium]|nr:hypothetical protein [Bryobacterales bacterium]
MPIPAREWTKEKEREDIRQTLIQAPATAWEEDAPTASLPTLRVLIVESDPEGVASLPEWGSVGQMEVLRAHSLSEGIFLLKHSRPDWILLDPNCQTGCPDDLVSFLRHATGIPMQIVSGVQSEVRLNSDIPCAASTVSPLEARVGSLAAKVVRHAERRRRLEKITTPCPSSGPRLRQHHPEAFQQLVEAYRDVLRGAVRELPYGSPERSVALQAVVHRLEEFRAHPRDVVELHLAAMRDVLAQVSPQSSRAVLKEGQTMLLKVMGYLAKQYLQASTHARDSRPAVSISEGRSAKRRALLRTS